ncbi:hypothetical protein FB561_6017 [Kribbella amoyensis]|uniref:Hemophore-related protein n=1 Tax=Kribbella amoyensis TaxID=996641 RepID=A0A561C0X5_9ACTN|nr:hypothetical protein [Kribbella amoyensis]TWD84821.1 hypothetical protein FB561_6017 [Kribbella amoyensis]
MRRRSTIAAAVLVLAVALGLVALSLPAQDGQDEDYCTGLQSYYTALQSFAGPTDTAALDQLVDQADNLSESAPEELRDDWRVLADYLGLLRSADGDPQKLAQLRPADPEAVTEAGRAIDAHGQQQCGAGATT